MSLDVGIGPFDFWEYTVGEVLDVIASYNRTQTQKQKEKVISEYRLSQMIAHQVSAVLSKDAKLPDIWEFAPALFEDERQQVEQARREQELLLHRERMRLFAERFNQRRKEGLAHGHDT